MPSWTVHYELRRDEPLTDEERELLDAHRERFADDWEDAEYDLDISYADGDGDGDDEDDDDEPLASGMTVLPHKDDHPEVARFLEALTDLRGQVPEAVLQVKDELKRVEWDEEKGRFVLREKKKKPKKPAAAKAEAPKTVARPTATRVVLPAPRYTKVGLKTWLDAVPVGLVLPPGDPSRWTSAFNLFGPGAVLSKGDRGYDRALDADMLRILMAEMGRPTDPGEQEALLLATPVPGDVPAAAVLSRMLRDSRYNVRQKAALCLGFLGDKSAVPALIQRLTDDDNDARRGAAEALGRLGDKSAAPALARAPWDSDSSVSAARLEAIDRLDAWADVAGVLDRSSGDDMASLCNAILGAIEEGEPGELGEFLGHSDRDVQRVAARFLSRRPALAQGCLDALVARIRESSDETVGVLCAQAIGGAGEEALETLVDLLGEDGWEVKAFACMAFSTNPALAAMAVEEIRPKLEDGDDDVRREAALAVLVSGEADPRAEEIVTGTASQRYGFLDRAAELTHLPALRVAGMLMGLVPPSLDLVPLLADTRIDGAVRGVAAMLLALAEPDLAAPLLDRQARDDARAVPMELRRYSAGGLLLTGYAPTFLPTVHRILLSHAGEVHTKAIGRTDELRAAAPELATLAAKDGDWPVRIEALRLLQQLGPDAIAPYRPFVAYAARHDPDADVRAQASSMLPAAWRSVRGADHLAETLVVSHGSGDDNARVTSFRNLAEAEPAIAGRLARHFFRSEERTLARAAGEILGRTVEPADAAAIVGMAMGRLENENWIAREAAADLLGHIPAERYPEGMLDEVAEALQSRISDDSDSDVRNAATAALGRLGRAPAAAEEE